MQTIFVLFHYCVLKSIPVILVFICNITTKMSTPANFNLSYQYSSDQRFHTFTAREHLRQ